MVMYAEVYRLWVEFLRESDAYRSYCEESVPHVMQLKTSLKLVIFPNILDIAAIAVLWHILRMRRFYNA